MKKDCKQFHWMEWWKHIFIACCLLKDTKWLRYIYSKGCDDCEDYEKKEKSN